MTSVSQGCAGIVPISSQRPSFLRSESNRRWTVAVADVPDDMLVAELERLRKMGMRAGEVHGVRPQIPFSEEMMIERSKHGKLGENGTATIAEEVEADEIEWGFARRAILCCREFGEDREKLSSSVARPFRWKCTHFFLSLSSYPAGSWTEYMFTDFRRGSNFAPPVPPQTHFRLEAPQLTLFGKTLRP